MNAKIPSIKNGPVFERPSKAGATIRFEVFVWASTLAVLFTVAAALVSAPAIRGDEKQPSDPWNSTQVLKPAELAQELTNKNGTPYTIVYVGFRSLFAGGHIPGASFHGTASTEQGLADLKHWADGLPRTANLVIYCGCCPFEKCPNIRPAFKALNEMGFMKMRALVLPTSFAADWADKGFPIEKGM